MTRAFDAAWRLIKEDPDFKYDEPSMNTYCEICSRKLRGNEAGGLCPRCYQREEDGQSSSKTLKSPRMVLDGMEDKPQICPCGSGKPKAECCDIKE